MISRESKLAAVGDDPYDRVVPSHVNRRGWIVYASVATRDGSRCVDFFEDPAGGFGFEEFRSDPEDGGAWTAVGGWASMRFRTINEAAARSLDAMAWLQDEPDASSAVNALRD